MKLISSVPEPYWYGQLKEFYEEGPQDSDIEYEDKLKDLGYIEKVDGDSCDVYIISSKGESAVVDYQKRSLRYARFQTAQIIALLTGFFGILVVLLDKFLFINAGTVVFLTAIVAALLIVSAISIELSFRNALNSNSD